jgi:DNA-binding MarR family transcriptional regulator
MKTPAKTVSPNDPVYRAFKVLEILSNDRPRLSTKQASAFLYVAMHQECGQVDIAQATGVSQSNAQRSTAEFMEIGLMERGGVASVHSSFKYKLTRKGQLLLEEIISYMKEIKENTP